MMNYSEFQVGPLGEQTVRSIQEIMSSNIVPCNDYENLLNILMKLKEDLEKKKNMFQEYSKNVASMASTDINRSNKNRQGCKNIIQSKKDQKHQNIHKSIYVQNDSLKKIVLPKEANIWKNTDIFFTHHFPTRRDISQFFSYYCKKSVDYEEVPKNGEHWTVSVANFANANGLPAPQCTKSKISPSDRLSSLKGIKFQVDECQMKTGTTINHLLMSLVESAPIERVKPLTPKKTTKSVHILAPKIPHMPYLSLDFNEKLNLELESIGLNQTSDDTVSSEDQFSREIENYKERIDEIVPKLYEYRDSVLPSVDDIVEKNRKLMIAKKEIEKYVEKA